MGGAWRVPRFTLKGENIMKIIVDKGNGFKITGSTDNPQVIETLKGYFPDYIDSCGDLVFCQDDLSAYYNELIPFLKKISNAAK